MGSGGQEQGEGGDGYDNRSTYPPGGVIEPQADWRNHSNAQSEAQGNPLNSSRSSLLGVRAAMRTYPGTNSTIRRPMGTRRNRPLKGVRVKSNAAGPSLLLPGGLKVYSLILYPSSILSYRSQFPLKNRSLQPQPFCQPGGNSHILSRLSWRDGFICSRHHLLDLSSRPGFNG